MGRLPCPDKWIAGRRHSVLSTTPPLAHFPNRAWSPQPEASAFNTPHPDPPPRRPGTCRCFRQVYDYFPTPTMCSKILTASRVLFFLTACVSAFSSLLGKLSLLPLSMASFPLAAQCSKDVRHVARSGPKDLKSRRELKGILLAVMSCSFNLSIVADFNLE